MAIVLHPRVFQKLAMWRPEALRDTGGITIPTLLLLRDYACMCVGLEPTSAALIYLPGPPSRSLAFGEVEGISTTDDSLTPVRISGMDPFWIHHKPDRPVQLRLIPDDCHPDIEKFRINEDANLQRMVGEHLSRQDMTFLVQDGANYVPDVGET